MMVKHKPVFVNPFFDDFFGNVNTKQENVSVNVHETNDAFTLEVNAPGRKKEDFKISADRGLLTISHETVTETNDPNYKTIRREFVSKSFKRSFSIDDTINIDSIQAKYEAGILSILLPKKDEIKIQPKEISIQ